jgi:CRISPR-associated protein Cas5d
MSDFDPVQVRVEGDWACFTRPELKVERVSYDVMTPSAARGLLEAIFWKPAFEWRVRRIHVLRPIRRESILRSEVNSVQSAKSARTWAGDGEAGAYYADDDHTQRHTLALRDVAYLIEANVHLVGYGKQEHPAKYRDQFRRRVARGQCFHRPYLGCREFAAHFGPPTGDEETIGRSESLGRMLFDLDYDTDGERNTPIFFHARLDDGTLHVPPELYEKRHSG